MLEVLICQIFNSIKITVCIAFKIMLEIKPFKLFNYLSKKIFIYYISVVLN